MALTFSPFFSPSEQTLDKVMLAQHVNLTQTAPPPTPTVQVKPEQVSADPQPKYVSTNPIHVARYFVESSILGFENEHAWFWFVILFVFCIVMLGLNIFLVRKVDSVLDIQSRLLLLASSSK